MEVIMVNPVDPSAAAQGSGGATSQQMYTLAIMKNISDVASSIMSGKGVDQAVDKMLGAVNNGAPPGLNNQNEVEGIQHWAEQITSGKSTGSQLESLGKVLWTMGEHDSEFRGSMNGVDNNVMNYGAQGNAEGAAKDVAMIEMQYVQTLNGGQVPPDLQNAFANVNGAQDPTELNTAFTNFNNIYTQEMQNR